MIQFIHPQKNEVIGYLSPDGLNAYSDDEHEREVRGQNRLTFTMPSNVKESEYVDNMARILVPHEKQGFMEYIPFETSTTFTRKRVVALGSEILLNKLKVINKQKLNAFTLAQYVSLATDGLTWQPGNIPNLGLKTHTVNEVTGAYDFLSQVETMFNVEFSFRIETDGLRVTGRYIDATVRNRMAPTGKEFVVGKDLVNIEKSMNNGDIVTALWCYGPDKSDGTPMAPVFVSDEAALARWGTDGQHLIGIYIPESSDQEMTQERLISLGNTELKKRIASVVDYIIEAIDLAPIYPHEEAFLGDVVRIKDPDFVPPLYAEARIVSEKRKIKRMDKNVPVLKTYTIGEVKEYTEEDVFATLRELSSQYGESVVRQPNAPAGKPGLIWIQPATVEGGLDVAYAWNGNTWSKITPTTPEEIGAEVAGTAAEMLQTARNEIKDVSDTLTQFQNEINTSFKDGIITANEAKNIAGYKNLINSEKADLDSQYTAIYSNVDLTGTPKTSLATAKTNYNTSHTALIAKINLVIEDQVITSTESTEINTAFTDYNTKLGLLSTALTNATNAITSKKAADAKSQAVAAAATDAANKASAAQTAAIEAANAETALAEIRAKTHADGIVTAEEEARIAEASANLAAAKADATTKADAALTASKVYADAMRVDLETQVGEVEDMLIEFEGTVGSTFKDGIIQEAEAKSIEKYKNSLNTEKLDIDNRFTKIYADASLTGTPKTNLNTAKTAYNGAHSALISSIDTAITDGKTTPTEKTDVDNKFAAYRTALGTLSTRFEEAITSLTAAKDTKIKTDAGTDATTKANAARDAAIQAAATDASTKAEAARLAAEAVAVAQAQAMEVTLKAYADGIVDAEETARIAEAQAVLIAAQNDATAKADAARQAAEALAIQEAAAVTDSENFKQALEKKADSDVIGELATKEEVGLVVTDLDDKIVAAIENQDFTDFARNEELIKLSDDLKKGLSSAVGVNLIKNSIGYGNLTFWDFTTTNHNIVSVMNEELSNLGFGAGFYFPPDGIEKGIQQIISVTPGLPLTLSWYINKATEGSFLIEILEDNAVVLTVPDVVTPGSEYDTSYVPYTPKTGQVAVRLTSSGTTEATVTGLMLGLGELPTQWTLANGELYNAYVRVNDNGLLVMRIGESGEIEGYTNMTPEEFAGYYDENRDGNFEKMFWFDRDETVTKKLRALEEITLGTVKMVRIDSTVARGIAFVSNVMPQ